MPSAGFFFLRFKYYFRYPFRLIKVKTLRAKNEEFIQITTRTMEKAQQQAWHSELGKEN
jgi:hypothetical protein